MEKESNVAKGIYHQNTAIGSRSWRRDEGWVPRSLYSACQEFSSRRRGCGIPVPSYIHRHCPSSSEFSGGYNPPFINSRFVWSMRYALIYILSLHVEAYLLQDLNSRSDYLLFLMDVPQGPCPGLGSITPPTPPFV